MQIKVFRERTAKDAMDKVRSELGPDAVILHTRKYTTGGIFGYGGKKMVEVTAAVEDGAQTKILPPINNTVKKDKAQPSAVNKTGAQGEPTIRPIVPRQILENYKTTGLSSSQKSKPVDANFLTEEPLGQPPKVIKNTDEMTMQVSNEKKQQRKIRQLEQELAQMKVVLNSVIGTKTDENIAVKRKTIALKEALQAQEVNAEIIKEIVAGQDPELLTDKDMPYVRKVLLDYLEKHMPSSSGIEIVKGKPKIVALIGATGVGKTTTLAKIASRFVLEQRLRAVLITADTYRISAVDQLKTYSDIIGLPLEIVYTPGELKKVINRHKDKQLILIDTAGRSQHNDYQLLELQDLLKVNDSIEKHLVLSATTKYKDIIDIIRKFSLCAPDKVIFTKTDETSSIGVVLNLLKEYPMALSYFTNGQSVPDDIFPAQPNNLADLLLR
ncbi:flagellar biosynthesis protein FlhF [Pectinatus cerevisiiphilus]|uniref:Flagellar biosynthesis protein FlhF n=1 Tax=Pectinatus cerevisiiphilus TaxID=86956 RepID=A0A4V2USC5_9FIRM|nr:flagellar biosynthesis protein FlhF [Pectinatus cerevisiiphilus]TCS80962.1 flagellar biosynthesis protein FlhF [Pectinatus cerevisiiphilus]